MYCFNFVWRNISLDPQFASGSFWSSDTTERAKDDTSTVASNATRFSDGDNNFNNHYLSSGNESDVDNDDDDSMVLEEDSKQKSKDWKQITKKDHKSKEKWYNKAAFLLDWLNRFSQNHCKHPVHFCF